MGRLRSPRRASSSRCSRSALFTQRFPPGYLSAAWALTGAFAAGTVAALLAGAGLPDRRLSAVGFAALVFDTAVVATYGFVFSYEYGNQTRCALVSSSSRLRFATACRRRPPAGRCSSRSSWFIEWWRVHHFAPPGRASSWDRVTFPPGLLLLTGLIVGWLVRRLDVEVRTRRRARGRGRAAARRARATRRRARGGEPLCARARRRRSRWSRRSVHSSARCAGSSRSTARRSCSSRTTRARTIATAGRGATDVFPPGSVGPLARLGARARARRARSSSGATSRDAEYPEDGACSSSACAAS